MSPIVFFHICSNFLALWIQNRHGHMLLHHRRKQPSVPMGLMGPDASRVPLVPSHLGPEGLVPSLPSIPNPRVTHYDVIRCHYMISSPDVIIYPLLSKKFQTFRKALRFLLKMRRREKTEKEKRKDVEKKQKRGKKKREQIIKKRNKKEQQQKKT